jgi:hypothetical protein
MRLVQKRTRGRHPASDPLPGLAGYRTPRSRQHKPRPPGRGGPSQFPPPPSIRSAPHTPGSPSRLHSRIYTTSMAFILISGARHSPLPSSRTGPLTTPQGFASCYGPHRRSPHRAFNAGLRPGPLPRQAASLLPGLLAATRTGLSPAGEELTNTKSTMALRHGVTSCSAGRTKPRLSSLAHLSKKPLHRDTAKVVYLFRSQGYDCSQTRAAPNPRRLRLSSSSASEDDRRAGQETPTDQ